MIKNLIDSEPDITHEQKMEIEKLLMDQQTAKEQELTESPDPDVDLDFW